MKSNQYQKLRRLFWCSLFALISFKISLAQCGTNPTSGTLVVSTANTIVNSYYLGTGSPVIGANTLTVGAMDGRGSATAIAAGDLVMIMQK